MPADLGENSKERSNSHVTSKESEKSEQPLSPAARRCVPQKLTLAYARERLLGFAEVMCLEVSVFSLLEELIRSRRQIRSQRLSGHTCPFLSCLLLRRIPVGLSAQSLSNTFAKPTKGEGTDFHSNM